MNAGRGGRRAVLAALVVYVALAAVMLLVPWGDVPTRSLEVLSRVLGRAGAPAALLAPTRFEFVANVLVVVPAIAGGAWLWPRIRWAQWTAYGFVASLAVETFQAVVLSCRSATFSDVVANTSGALIGSLLAEGANQLRESAARRQDQSRP